MVVSSLGGEDGNGKRCRFVPANLRSPPKRRAWRKLHLAVDAGTGEIVASDLTGRRTPDCAWVPALIEQLEDPVASVSADGAYDTTGVYEAAQMKGDGHAVRVLIPPGRNAQLSPRPSAAQRERNRNVRSIRDLGRRRMAEALRLQQAQHGGEHHVPLQDDHRSTHAKSNLRWTTSRGTAGEQDPQHDDPSRDA